MTTIRPNPQPPLQTPAAGGGAGQTAARLAAQKAFFALAAGRAAPAAEAAAPAPAPAQPAPVNRTASAEAPQKILRPGSILDIRV